MNWRRRERGFKCFEFQLLMALVCGVIGAIVAISAARAGGFGPWWADLGIGWRIALAVPTLLFVVLPLLMVVAQFVVGVAWIADPPRGVEMSVPGDPASRRSLAGPRGDCWIDTLAFTGEGLHLIGLDTKHRVHVWRRADGERVAVLRGPWGLGAEVRAVARGDAFICGGGGRGVSLHRLADGQRLAELRGPGDWVQTIATSDDGRVLALAVHGKGIELRSLPDGALRRTIPVGDRCETMALSRDGAVLVGRSGDSACAWRTADGLRLQEWPQPDHAPQAVAVTSDGTRCAVAGFKQPTRVLDIESGRQVTECGGDVSVGAIAFTPDGRRLAASRWDSEVRVYDARTGALIATTPGSEIAGAIAWSPDGEVLAAMVSRRGKARSSSTVAVATS